MNLSATSAPHSSNEAPAACGAPGGSTLPSPSGETTTVSRPYRMPRTYDCVSERAGTLLIGLGCKMTSGR